MADQERNRNEEIPAPPQDGMVNTPAERPKSLSDNQPNESPLLPVEPPEEGHVDEQAAVDEKQPGEMSMTTESSELETAGPVHSPTVAELDKSYESELESSAQDPAMQEKPAEPKPKEGKKTNVLLAVVVAFMIVLLLVGIGYAAWQANNNENANVEESETTQTTTETLDTSDADGLDQELEQLEGELEQLETDLDETNLDDESIGL